jgi:hypothetical protein
MGNPSFAALGLDMNILTEKKIVPPCLKPWPRGHFLVETNVKTLRVGASISSSLKPFSVNEF